MMTMMVVSYIISWINMIYSYLTVKSDTELWGEEIE
ncbi:hypothetical protein SAMN05444362_12225 [Dysgonomonas macrotermitis]|uniref:Uncharacterized protein n=1 Tax=Dysgonomonas macrotermitis TaxID=1346286 RepID=A0A1M5J6X4_9BACT|nr:hypothetical protein SAMN05444362_12225 [Dysgonomonas macrotermitis]